MAKKQKTSFLVEVEKEVRIRGYIEVVAKDKDEAMSAAEHILHGTAESNGEIEWRYSNETLMDSNVLGCEVNT